MSSKTVRRFKHDEVLSSVDPMELEAEVPESKFKPFVIAVIGVVLLALTVSWVFSDFLQSHVESAPAKDNVLDFGSAKIIFHNNTLAALQREFVGNQHREIKACLFGSTDGKTYNVEGVSFPEIIRANVVHVVSVPCPESIIIDAHSHPIDECLASEQDVSTLRVLQSKNSRVRMLVMCGQERFALV